MARNAGEIDHARSQTACLGAPRREFDEEFLAGIPRDSKVLEIGSGYGRQLNELREMGFGDLSGLDLNLAGLKRSTFAGIQSDAHMLPVADDSFDMVYTSGALMHIHPLQLRQVTDEIVRVTRKWFWCFEAVSAKLAAKEFDADLCIPTVWLWDIPALISLLQPNLKLIRGRVWDGANGQFAMLLYEKNPI